MNDFETLLIEYLELKSQFSKTICLQQYEKAAYVRDEVREMGRELYITLYDEGIIGSTDEIQDNIVKDNIARFKWNDYNDEIRKYCDKRFGTLDVHLVKKLINRSNNLNKLLK